MAPRARALRTKLLVALGALVLSLLVVEAGMRMAGIHPLGDVPADADRAFVLRPSEVPGLVYEPTPGATGRVWKTDVRINAHGFRDRERAPERRAGVPRIVALGDSITFGNHLPVEDTWPRVLEALYAEAGHEVEVLNLGVGGYDTTQEVLFLEAVGLAFHPDWVFVAVCVNDVATVSVNLGEFERFASLRAGLARVSRLAQWVLVQRGRLSLADEMERQRAAEARGLPDLADDPERARGMDTVRRVLAAAVPTEDESDARRLGREILGWYADAGRLARLVLPFERLERLARTHDFRVVVCVVPFLEDDGARPLAEGWEAAYALVAHEAERLGFHVVDLAPAFGAELEGLRRRPLDPIHPSARGHRLMAEALLAGTRGLPGLPE